MNWPGIVPPFTSSTNSKPVAARQRLDAQEHLAELARAAGLLLVAMMAFGLAGDGFAIGDARRARFHLDAVLVLQALDVDAQVQVGQAADHGFVGLGFVLDDEAGILLGQLVQRGGQLLLLALVRGFDRQAEHRLGESPVAARWIWSSSWLSCSTASKCSSSTLATAAMSPGIGLVDLDVVLALELEQVADLERLLAVVDEQLRVLLHRALVDAEDAELADEGIVDDLEHVGDDVLLRIGRGFDRFAGRGR